MTKVEVSSMPDKEISARVAAIRDFMAGLFPDREVRVAENHEIGCVDFIAGTGQARARLRVSDEVLSDVSWETLKDVFQRDNLKGFLSQAQGRVVAVTQTETEVRLELSQP